MELEFFKNSDNVILYKNPIIITSTNFSKHEFLKIELNKEFDILKNFKNNLNLEMIMMISDDDNTIILNINKGNYIVPIFFNEYNSYNLGVYIPEELNGVELVIECEGIVIPEEIKSQVRSKKSLIDYFYV